ncbi:MAG: Imm27 family immunity protein [Pyrinomonadaceae bacterium]
MTQTIEVQYRHVRKDDKGLRLSRDPAQACGNENLIQRKVDDVNWKVLWQDSQTGEFWKEYFPQSEMHAGGPPEFAKITEEEAKAEFGSW